MSYIIRDGNGDVKTVTAINLSGALLFQSVPTLSDGTPVSNSAPLPVLSTSVAVNSTDHSGTVTAANTPQNVTGANANRKALTIFNLSQSDFLWVNLTGTAAIDSPGSFPILPLDYYQMPSNQIEAGAVSVISATTGHKFTVKEA